MSNRHIPKMRRCQHVHLSGRRCSQRVGKATWRNAEVVVWVCGLHKADECGDCDAMLRAFPLRKSVTLPPV